MTLLEVRELMVRFGGLIALSNVSFDVREGEILSVIGPNGAGKTTLFNVITGFGRPTAGQILHRGTSLVGRTTHAISELGIIRTFQKTTVFPEISVLDSTLTGLHRSVRAGAWDIVSNSRRKRAEDATLRTTANTNGWLDEAANVAGGGMAEWTIATVLKTVEAQASGGSNPPPSALVLGA